MSELVVNILILLFLFQIKHMLADYFFQTRRMLEGRGTYLHFGTFIHAGIHAFGSLIVFGLIGALSGSVLLLVALEWIVHFHIDCLKGRYTAQRKLTPENAAYWRVFGVDQTLHYLTYLGMVAAWAWGQGGL